MAEIATSHKKFSAVDLYNIYANDGDLDDMHAEFDRIYPQG